MMRNHHKLLLRRTRVDGTRWLEAECSCGLFAVTCNSRGLKAYKVVNACHRIHVAHPEIGTT